MSHVARPRRARVHRLAGKPPVARPSARPGAGHRAGPTRPERQRGVALVVALVLLVATSVLAIATLSGTRLGERQGSNAQYKAVASEAAESGVGSVLAGWKATRSALGAGTGNEPEAVELPDLGIELDAGYDQAGAGDAVDLDLGGRLTAQYCGSRAAIGSDLNADRGGVGGGAPVDLLFDVRAVVTTGGVAARADHVQRVAKLGPSGGRTGRCPAP